jgi:hypothetical protein
MYGYVYVSVRYMTAETRIRQVYKATERTCTEALRYGTVAGLLTIATVSALVRPPPLLMA